MHRQRRLPQLVACAVFFIIAILADSALSAGPEQGILSLLSYNIHHGEGTDGKLDLERIAEAIREADIVALQEVDNNWGERSGFVHQAQWLAEKLNRYYVYAANLDLDGSAKVEGVVKNSRRQYGMALLSRYPIEFSRNYPLPRIEYLDGISEQRSLLETQVDMSGSKLRIYVTHLSNSSKEQRLLPTGPPLGGICLHPGFLWEI